MTWNKLQKVSLYTLAALLLCPAIAGAQTEGTTILPRVGVDFNSPRSGDDERSYGRVTGFIPLGQTSENSLTFIDTAARINSTGDLGGTVTLGQRYLKSGLIFGGHLSYDIRDTGSNTFHQLGLGAEVYGDTWDVHLNGYLPVGDTQQSAGSTGGNAVSGTQFQGNQLVFITAGGAEFIESAWGGIDLDAGMELVDWDEWGTLWGYGGVYYHGDAIGGRLRLDHRVQDRIRVGLGVQSDDNFGTRGFFSVGFSWGGGTSDDADDTSLWARAAESVTRNSSIVVKESEIVTIGGTEIAIDPATGQAYTFVHVTPDATVVAGDGTIENPATSIDLVNAQAGDIVYVTEGDSRTNPLAVFIVPAGVEVLSDAIAQTVATQAGDTQLPGSGTGVLPLIDAAGADNGVTLIGGDNRLSGFEIIGAVEAGVEASDAANFVVDNNQITDGVGLGIRSENITNGVIDSNTINNIAGGAIGVLEADGIVIQNNQVANIDTDTALGAPAAIVAANITGSADISNNTVSETAGPDLLNGLGIAVANTTGDLDLNLADNTVVDNEGEGIAVLVASDGNTVVDITGNLVENNNGQGIFTVNNTGTLTLDVTENIIRGNQNDGIGVLVVGDAVGTMAINNNVIETNGTTPPFLQGDGIKVGIEEDAMITQLEISGNVIDGNLDDGIDVSVGQFEGVFLPPVPLPVPGFGAIIGASNATLENATIDNNTVANTQNGQGIVIRSLGENSNLAVSIEDNTLTDNALAGVDALSIDTNQDGTTSLCLALTDNDSDSGYLLTEAPNSTFTVVNRNTVATDNTGTVTFQPAEANFDTVVDISSCPD